MKVKTDPALPAIGRCEEHGVHNIELDCPPGMTRPWHLINGVLRGTGLKVEDPEKQGAFFGMAIYWFGNVPCAEWNKVQKIVEPRITELYNQGVIRYGSW